MDDATITRLFSVMDTKPLGKLVAQWKTKYPEDGARLLALLDGMAQVMPKEKIALSDADASSAASAAASGTPAPDSTTAPAPDAATQPPASPDAGASPATTPAPAPTSDSSSAPSTDAAPPATTTAPAPLAPPPDSTQPAAARQRLPAIQMRIPHDYDFRHSHLLFRWLRPRRTLTPKARPLNRTRPPASGCAPARGRRFIQRARADGQTAVPVNANRDSGNGTVHDDRGGCGNCRNDKRRRDYPDANRYGLGIFRRIECRQGEPAGHSGDGPLGEYLDNQWFSGARFGNGVIGDDRSGCGADFKSPTIFGGNDAHALHRLGFEKDWQLRCGGGRQFESLLFESAWFLGASRQEREPEREGGRDASGNHGEFREGAESGGNRD